MENENWVVPDPVVSKLGNALDAALGVISVSALAVGGMLLGKGVTFEKLLFIDLSGIDWGTAWEVLEGLGIIGGMSRLGVWLWQKFGGDKYAMAIWWQVDQAAPHGITRDDLQQKVREMIKPKNEAKFQKKYAAAWAKLRSKGEIVLENANGTTVVRLGVDTT